MKHIAIYCRVSSTKQSIESQVPDLRRWTTAYAGGDEVRWYEDVSNDHKRMDREGWNQLESAIEAGEVSKIVVWKLDRLGRNASKLVELFERLKQQGVRFISVTDGLDSQSAAFTLISTVLAAVAQYDNEIRSERVRAGKARSNNKNPRKGKPVKATAEVVEEARRLRSLGMAYKTIGENVGLSEATVRRVLIDDETRAASAQRKNRHNKLSPNDVAVFKNLVTSGESMTNIAQTLKISRMHAYRLKKTYFGE